MTPLLNTFMTAVHTFGIEIANCPTDEPDCTGNTNLPEVVLNESTVRIGLQLVFGVIGTMALIYIVLSAFQLVASQGDPQALAKARQSIIFAVIGLVVALSAEILVSFVIMRI